MEKTITLTMTESQAKKFEELLDKLNATVSGEIETSNSQTETLSSLAQAKKELEKIKQFNANREKMIWEQ